MKMEISLDRNKERSGSKATGFQNNTVDPTPTISRLYRRQGGVHTRRNNRFHSADLTSSESTSGSFHFVREIEGPSIHRMHPSRSISRVREANLVKLSERRSGSNEEKFCHEGRIKLIVRMTIVYIDVDR